MILFQCDTCKVMTLEVKASPTGIPILPPGWTEHVAIVENVHAPRPVFHACEKLECKPVLSKPEDSNVEKEADSWGTSGIR